MKRIHFYLERRNAPDSRDITRESPIILSLTYSAKRIKIYTGLKIPESFWDLKTERATGMFVNSLEINKILDSINARILNYLMQKGELTQAIDFKKMKLEIKKLLKSQTPDFFELLLKFLEVNSSNWSQSTYKKMKTFYIQMIKFSEELGYRFQPSEINQAFADKLIGYYRKNGKQDSSIKKNLELLKWFMNWSLKEDLIISRDFEKIRFEIGPQQEVKNSYFLKWDELLCYFDYQDLSKKEEWSRDIFCFIAFTGIRYSKLVSLKKKCVSYPYIQTGERKKDMVQLNAFALEIVKKYENKYYKSNALFPPMTIITFLKYLKSGACKAGLKRILFPEKGNFYPVPIFDLISAQIAINTYIAHSLRLGIANISNTTDSSLVSEIRTKSGAYADAELMQKSLSEHLYESIRNSRKGAAQLL